MTTRPDLDECPVAVYSRKARRWKCCGQIGRYARTLADGRETKVCGMHSGMRERDLKIFDDIDADTINGRLKA